eukprot:CAMPEP_0114265166 /NCGR_PEP_ID=MMETSP0058-20121206/23720_1 /TAXON_ID=36894 /ORGANISM="Pyramimonas parkeae, CCMP726" /LENGTH=170 /DNA_ID=CAMNT_0001382139 /DNA_START=283 /DNA_END=795 /DNA_ORIENTATION=-
MAGVPGDPVGRTLWSLLFACALVPIFSNQDGVNVTIHHYGTNFTFYPHPLSFADARSFCRTNHPPHGNLVTFRSAAEVSAVVGAVTVPASGFWSGLNDRAVEGDFQGVDGYSGGFANWGSAFPRDGSEGTNADCAAVFGQGSFQDEDCTTQKPFVCAAEMYDRLSQPNAF